MLYIPGKIPIRIHPYFWLLAAFIGWINSFSDAAHMNIAIIKTSIWIVVITVSLLIHEYGHALTALFFGHTAKIDLIAFGGVTQRQGPKLKLWKEFLIVLNGPLFGFILAGVTYFILNKVENNSSNLAIYALKISVYINVFWTIINLLPIQPLDGGKLFSIVLEAIFGVNGIKIAYGLSILFAVVVGIIFFTLQAILAGSLFFLLAFESYRAFQEIKVVNKHDDDDEMQDLLKIAQDKIRENKKDEAIYYLKTLRDQTQSGILYTKATQYLAFLLDDEKNFKEAYALLKPIKKRIEPSYLPFLQKLAFKNEDFDEAIVVGDELFKENSRYEIAFINALCYALKKQVKPSIGWLESAVRAGMPNVKVMISKNEFDAIREDPLFKNFIKGL